MSRPPKEIDWNKVDEMLEYGCLGTEIAAYFCMHPITFYERVEKEFGVSFTHYSQEKAMAGNDKLRKTQYEIAVKDRNVTMAIWLGKQRLGQHEPEQKIPEAQHQCAFNQWAQSQVKEKEEKKVD